MAIVVKRAADVVQKHTIAVQLFAIGTHKRKNENENENEQNVGFAVPVETTQHWYNDEALTRDVYNQVVSSVFTDDNTGERFLNDKMSKFKPVDACEVSAITTIAWQLFAPQTKCGDEELTTCQNYKAKNGGRKNVFMGELSYLKHGKIPKENTETTLNIWFFEGPDHRGVLLPGGLGMS